MSNKRQEFKEEAVAHWQNTDKTAEEVATNLGIPSEKYGSTRVAVKSSFPYADKKGCVNKSFHNT